MTIATSGINPSISLGLPSAYIENIKILPRNWTTDEQEIEIELSLQTIAPALSKAAFYQSRKIFDGSYRVFVAFSSNPRPLLKMTEDESIAKNLIRDPKKTIQGGIIRRYLERPGREARLSRVLPSPKASENSIVVLKKALTFTHKFLLEELDDLYMYVTTYATDPQTIDKTGVNRKIKAMKISPPATETIMIDTDAPLKSAVFVLEGDNRSFGRAGEVWPGPIHYNDEMGFMAGASHTEASHPPLSAKLVSNQKIKDFRFLEAIRGLSFSDTPASAQVLTLRQRKDLEKAAKIIKKPGKVSDCSYSRTANNELKISFAIDYMRLVRENTKLGFLIKNEDALMSCFKIENIQIWRSRINANVQPNMLTPGKINICGSNTKLASTSAEKLIATLRNGLVRPVQFRGLNKQVLNVVVTDQDMANHDVGTYEYRVVIEMVDLSTTAITYTIERLTKFLTEYNKFLAAADSMGAKGFNIQARLKRNKVELLELNQQWKRLINSFMTSIEFIFGRSAFPEFSSISWRKNLITMANPANGDLKSMMLLSETIKDFLSNLMMVSRDATSAASAGSSKVTSKIKSGNKSKRKIVLEHVFASNYTRNSTADEGTDYLDDSVTLDSPLNFTSIGFINFIGRIDAELEKFGVPRPNNPGVNKFGFLTPKRLNAKGSSIETSTVNLSQGLGYGILNASLSPNKIRSFTPSNNSDDIYNSEIGGILGASDVTIAPNTTPLEEVLRNPEPLKRKTIFSSDYLSSNTPFNKSNLDAVTAASGSEEINAYTMGSIPSSHQQIKGAGVVNHIMNMKAIDFKPPPAFIPADSAEGCLAVESAAQNPSTLDMNTTFGQSVNFNSLAEVQYFDGYLVSSGMINLNQPIWRTLTQSDFESMQASRAKVLCRTMLISRSMRMPNRYELPEYDSLFILGDSTAGPAVLNYGAADYTDIFKSMWRKFQSEMKLDSLNIQDSAANIDTSYIKVPLEMALGIPVTPGAKIGGPRARRPGGAY